MVLPESGLPGDPPSVTNRKQPTENSGGAYRIFVPGESLPPSVSEAEFETSESVFINYNFLLYITKSANLHSSTQSHCWIVIVGSPNNVQLVT